jgi:hypothetical protein
VLTELTCELYYFSRVQFRARSSGGRSVNRSTVRHFTESTTSGCRTTKVRIIFMPELVNCCHRYVVNVKPVVRQRAMAFTYPRLDRIMSRKMLAYLRYSPQLIHGNFTTSFMLYCFKLNYGFARKSEFSDHLVPTAATPVTLFVPIGFLLGIMRFLFTAYLQVPFSCISMRFICTRLDRSITFEFNFQTQYQVAVQL